MKKYYLKLLAIAVLALVAMQLRATPIDAAAAQSRAASFLKSHSQGKLLSPGVELRLSHAEKSDRDDSLVDFYVFNSTDGGGFVIVPGDDCAEEILGYGAGQLDMDNLPCNLKWWLDGYKEQMEWLFSHSEKMSSSSPRRSPADGITVEPLLTCRWSQMDPYNGQCPDDDYGRCVTGCVATAMAQVMYYWKYPESLPSLQGYYFNYYDIYHVQVSSLPGTPLDWDNMIDKYTTGYTEEQSQAVATLMRYCGQGCFMEYSSEGSGSTAFNQLMAFKKFGYNPSARLLMRDNFDEDQWCSMLIGELQSGHPVPYVGRGDSGGHAFVIDGCKDGLYHVNWGWSGSYDGFFSLDALKGRGFDFRFEQSMNFQIQPDDGTAQELEAAYDFEVDGIYYLKNGDQATVTYKDGLMNCYSGIVEVPEQVEWEGKTYQVTAVGDYAFSYNPSLTALRLPYIRTIGENYIDGCTELDELYLGKSLESIGFCAYYSCPLLQWVDVEDVNAWASMDFRYESPLTLGLGLHSHGEPVTTLVMPSGSKVGSYTFTTLKSLEHVILEDGVQSVGDDAFWGCDNLKTLTIGKGIKRIGVASFSGCNSLKSVKFGLTAGSIDDSAFYGDSCIEDLTLPDTINTIAYAAFAYCDKLKKLEFHHVDSISMYAFFGCSNLQELSFQGTVRTVENNAFSNCFSLERVNAGDLGSWCGINFRNSEANPLGFTHALYVDDAKITDLVIPDGVKSIGSYAFCGASDVVSVSFPTSVEFVGSSAFKGCSGLNRVTAANLSSWCGINFGNSEANPLKVVHHLEVDGSEVTALVVPDDVDCIGNFVFANCDDITSVVTGDNLKSIGDNAFHICKNLTTVNLGDGLKTIGEKAFGTCTKLTSVNLGSGLEYIGEKAFASCMVISDITCKAMTPPEIANKNAFSSLIYSKAAVTVPQSALDAYMSDGIWGQFTDIVGGFQEFARGDVNRDGEVNIADVNTLVKGIQTGCFDLDCYDVNGDGEVNINDVNAVIRIIMQAE